MDDVARAQQDYEDVAYPAPILASQTPDRLGAAALMYGLSAPDPLTASVLEIGCGTGYNLIGIGAVAPRSKCVGFDLSPSAIALGRKLVDVAGLTNVDLHQGDITTYPLDGEKFDYIACHGVYSWVPDFVRTALLKLMGARLAPGGIAYLSYDCLPAASTKAAINRFIRPRVAHIADIAERVDAAVSLIATLARHQTPKSRIKPQLQDLVSSAPGYQRGYFYHDWLAEFYAPSSALDLGTAAAEAGLALVGEVGLQDLALDDLDLSGLEVLNASVNPVERSYALDLLRGSHMFRRDILVRADTPPADETDPLGRLNFSLIGVKSEPMEDNQPGMVFRKDEKITMTAISPGRLSILETLHRISPDELSREGLAAATGVDAEELEQTLQQGVLMGLIDAHASPQNFVITPGERPRAGPLVRAMMAEFQEAISLRHGKFEAREEPTRIMLALCDGTRTRAEIAAAMSAHYGNAISTETVNAAIRTYGRSRLFEA